MWIGHNYTMINNLPLVFVAMLLQVEETCAPFFHRQGQDWTQLTQKS